MMFRPGRFQNVAAMGGVATPVTPDSVFGSDLVGWWKSDVGVLDAGLGSISNGEQVGRWENQAGSGHLNLIAGLNGPLFNSVSNYNAARPSLYFNGTNDALRTAVQVLAMSTTQLTAIFVGRINNTGSGAPAILSWNSTATALDDDYDSTESWRLLCRDVTNSGFSSYYNSANCSPQPVTTGSNHRFGVVLNGTTLTTFLDGVADSGPATVATPTMGANGGLAVGGAWASWNGGLLGDLSSVEGMEIIIAKRAATNGEMANLETYATTTWGS